MVRFWNNTKTALLLGALFGLILLIGYLMGGTGGIVIALIIGTVMNVGTFFFSDKVAIKAMRGQEVDQQSAPDLIQMVSRLARNANLPMPRVYICPQEAPNAFATGRSPRHAAVAVTQGALRLLSYEELEGVMGHELSHVKNRDTLTSTIAAIIGGAISMLSYFAIFIPLGDDDEGGGLLGMLLMVIVAPIAAGLIQAAISRSREFVADHDGATLAGTPDGLMSALQKLENTSRRVPMQNQTPAFNHMFIVQPLSGGFESMAKLFSSHPPTRERIANLRKMER